MKMSLKAARINAKMDRPTVIKKLKEEKDVHISKNTLVSYENNKTKPDVLTASAIVSIYGLSIEDISWA